MVHRLGCAVIQTELTRMVIAQVLTKTIDRRMPATFDFNWVQKRQVGIELKNP